MRIDITDDFDLEKIAGSGQCFRWERIGPQEYRIPFQEECLRIKYAGGNSYDLDCTAEEFEQIWKRYFDLEENYSVIRSRIDPDDDPYLFWAAEKEKGIRILRQDQWETLVSFIVSQNRSIPVIRRSIEMLCMKAGKRKKDRAGEEYAVFPDPKEMISLSDEDLRDCRLGYRSPYITAAAEYVLSKSEEWSMLEKTADAEVLAKLMKIRGVGIKVATCTALFGLHRMDLFPVDTRIRNVLEKEYPLGFPLDKYSPWCGVYQQYLYAGQTVSLSRT